ncbi:MAG: hypothetical protein HDS41_00370 [Bacteroides sp.]|nr:hypothetical protein [Bacteroides sp.]
MRVILLFLALGLALCNVKGQNFEPKWVGQVVLLDIENDTIVKPTEKATVKIKTKQSAGRLLVGIGNVRRKVYIQGGASPVQLDPTKPITIIIKCKDNSSDPSSFIQVVEFEKGRNERRTELAMENWIGNISEGNMKLVPYDADVYGKNSYILTIQPKNGEFGVRVLNPNDIDEKVPIFYCFGTSSFGQSISGKKDSAKSDYMTSEETEDHEYYKYKGIMYPIYKDNDGKSFIFIDKQEKLYIQE